MRILVLLSTWNGSRYIREQLDSILEQHFDGSLHVLIRDDGSSDNTVQMIAEKEDKRVEVIRGENLGAKGSFLALLKEARSRNADFVALADQDDVWLPGKLQRAVNQLRGKPGPVLYCSALSLVNDELQPLGEYSFAGEPSFEAAFFSNCVTGCTCVLNSEMLAQLDVLPEPGLILMHDWWLYIVAAAFGTVIYDHNSYILYRQHAANQVGLRLGVAAFLHRTKMFLRRPRKTSRLAQAQEFKVLYGHKLAPERARYLSELVACTGSFQARLRFALTRRPRRRQLLEEIAAVIAFLVGR